MSIPLAWAALVCALPAAVPADPESRPADSAAPRHVAASPAYARMLAAVERYERIAESGGWQPIPPGPTIEPGSLDPRIAVLAQRLIATGDLERRSVVLAEYDAELQAAVRRFQVRHGLEPDALAGKNTLRAMNLPVAARLDQLRLNLARTRAVFQADRQDFLLVNVPAFEVHLVRDGEIAWTERAIVGETETETPLFEAMLTHVVLNPTWTVPRKIATEELLPKIQADPAFLYRGGYDVLDAEGKPANPAEIDWASLHSNNFPVSLVQRPGPMNELGQIKFLFPNDHRVCMHDTPSRYLFGYASRAFSHGCIRVADPINFAEQLLGHYGWTRDRIEAGLAVGTTRSISLPSPLAVVVAYLTAMTGEDGTVYFYYDIYGRDSPSSTQEPP